MKGAKSRRVWFAAVCFVMFAITAYFVIEAMGVIGGEYAQELFPAIVYYTIQTNILAAVWVLYLGLETLIPKLRITPPMLSLFVVTYITLTCVVYWAALVPMLGFDEELFSVRNIWMHTGVTVFAAAIFLFVLRGPKIRRRRLGYVIVYPLAYLALVYALRLATGEYVYPFFNPEAMGGGFGVALALLVIAVLLVGFGLLYRFAWNKRCAGNMRAGGQSSRK